MMNREPNRESLELQRIVAMLDRTVEMVQDSEVTGHPGARSAAAIRSFNATVRQVTASGLAPAALFAALPDDASLTDVGISSAQLAEYLRVGLPEELREREKEPVISRMLSIGHLHLTGAADEDELAQQVREYVAEFLGAARPESAAEGRSSQLSEPTSTPLSSVDVTSPAVLQAPAASPPAQPAQAEEGPSELRSQTRR